MKDKRSSYTNDHELRFAGEQGFFDKSSTVRFCIALVFAFSLFLFFHFRDVRVAVLELGSRAKIYVVAESDFDFVDREATIILRQEAVRNVGKIYRLTEQQLAMRRTDFENLLARDEVTRDSLIDVSYEEVASVLDTLQKAALNLRMTDPRTRGKVREAGLSTSNYQTYTPMNASVEAVIPRGIWVQLARETLSSPTYSQKAVQVVLHYFQQLPWKLEEDIPVEHEVRSRIEDQVQDKITHVNAGSRIIDQGEKVTNRHIAMMQAMKKELHDKRNLWHSERLIGTALMALLFTIVCGAFIKINHPTLFHSNRKLCLLVTIVVLNLAFAKGVEVLLLSSQSYLLDAARFPLLVPFGAILCCNLIGAMIVTFFAGLLTVLFTLALAFDQMGFMVVNLIAALICIMSTKSLRRRKEIFSICFKAFLGVTVLIFSIHFYKNTVWSTPMIADLVTAALFLIITAGLVLSILPLLESLFHVMSDVTLMEYMDPNNELLRRLAFEAPGTYQHTLMVCNIAEAAGLAIGANGLFCRVASLYHDIGKMVTPHFFTENQQGEVNVHQLLTPLESAQTIIAHVSEGVAMARKSGLPEQFIDIIKQHHGTTLVYYFYRKQLDQAGGDPSSIDESLYRYAGPKPRTKESAIIMIADTFEAASRSLDLINDATLTELIDRLIREKAEDQQFDECLLTFEELSIVKKTMVQTLVAGLHTRIKYPKRPRKE